MSAINQFNLLAQYNHLMNKRQYEAAATLTKVDLCQDKGAFFKSVLGTLNHLLVGDIIWLKRFADHPSSADSLTFILELDRPKSLDTILFTDFDKLTQVREIIDIAIINWVRSLTEDDVNSCISYSNMAGKVYRKPLSSLMSHLFLHQVHHRGQVTTLLSQFGIDFGETDLIEIINECSK